MFSMRRGRRGVILLVVLGLLTLFALIVVTFYLTAAQTEMAVKASARVEQHGDAPERLLNAAIMQVLRGTNNPHSVLRPHSLLEDMYGNAPVRGRITGAEPFGTGGTMLLLRVNGANDTDNFFDPLQAPGQTASPTVGHYCGRVLTMLDGPAAGQSTRILGYETDGLNTPVQVQLRVMAFDGVTAANLQPGNTFLINSRPFSGTGFGYRQATANIDALFAPDQPYALLPNPVFFAEGADPYRSPLNNMPDPAGLGGANEDYDIPDFQNMLLAMVVRDGPNTIVPIPSLHRPALLNYWIQREGGTFDAVPAALRRKISLRPIGQGVVGAEHPEFTGSNATPAAMFDFTGTPVFTSANPPWDVDNDGDGIADSIWVDIGLPVQTLPDGRRYKHLVAILCVDLDGRLNLNAHGNVAHLGTESPDDFSTLGPYARDAMGPPLTVMLPRGQGYGPADIRLATPNGLTPTDVGALLLGDPARGLEGRYGEVQRNAANWWSTPAPFASLPLAPPPFTPAGPFPAPGVSNVFDFFSAVRFGLPDSYDYRHELDAHPTDPAFFTQYGSPPDIQGVGSVGLNLRGQPIFQDMALQDHVRNNPYLLDLSSKARGQVDLSTLGTGETGVVSADGPFTPAELARVLRPFDVDAATAPTRLVELAPSFLSDPTLRHLVTTESWDVPSPSVLGVTPTAVADIQFANTNGVPISRAGLHITDLLRARLRARNPGLSAADFETLANRSIPMLLSPELIGGLRMDVNRPFGNGRDANGNLVVDDPSEEGMQQLAWPDIPPQLNEWAGAYFDANNNGLPDDATDPNYIPARQLFARHLYVLAMLLTDLPDFSTNPNEYRAHARRLAQWAVNVVDFRDRDSIMTPFEYDVFPFQDNDSSRPGTWDVDGDLTTEEPAAYRDVVWGCERPELLITETFAVHERRTEDLADPNGLTTDDPPNRDDHYDQQFRPLGSLFIELYNPQGDTDIPSVGGQPAPAEIYEPTDGSFVEGADRPALRLDKRTPDTNFPVWRLAIRRANNVINNETEAMRPPEEVALNPAEDRVVYFVKRLEMNDPMDGITDITKRYYRSGDVADAQPDAIYVLPNRYAVIGPARNTRINPPGGTTDLALTTQVSLDFTEAEAANSPVDISGPTMPPTIEPSTYPAVENHIKRPVAVVVDSPRRLSISEPYQGDEAPNTYETFPPGADVDTWQKSPPDNVPWDWGDPVLQQDGTLPEKRWVFLQRLANPLLPWDAQLNPYVTIDRAAVDLTVYNGKESSANEGVLQPPGQTYRFASRQRNEFVGPEQNIWRDDPSVVLPEIDPPNLQHTLGFTPHFHLGPVWTDADGVPPEYIGSPQDPPNPWLTWNNRPFISAYELMQVPASAPWRLLGEHALQGAVGAYAERNFDPDAPGLYTPQAPFSHLMNVFHSSDVGPTISDAINIHRIFEFLTVPSRFVGTETWLDPNFVAGLVNSAPPGAFGWTIYNDADGFFGPTFTDFAYGPPFNRVSRFREPGRLNINTVFDPAVSVGDDGGAGFQSVFNSIRGFPATPPSYYERDTLVLSLDPDYPTFFANPFRTSAGAHLAPIDTMKRVLPYTSQNRLEVDATLLRRNPTNAQILFHPRQGEWGPHNDPLRNPYFAYEGHTQLGNLVTTRSNVYAVWITVGRFEVTQVPVDRDAGHPDGWQLEAEIGEDTGEIERHRAFYIIDRSIPVAFERGQNHNVEKCILLRQVIE